MTAETKHTPDVYNEDDFDGNDDHIDALKEYAMQIEAQRDELAAALRKIALMDGYNELMEAISIAEAVLAKVSA